MRFVMFVIAILAAVTPCEASVLYVSATGTATTGCTSPSAACSTLEYALNAARPNDIIVCVSPPLRSTLYITKSITIDCSAARAVSEEAALVQNNSYSAIIISITATTDPLKTVRLRGLTYDGGSSGSDGRTLDRIVDIQAAAAVYIEDCVFSSAKSQGIYDHRSGGQTRLYVKDTVISGNAGPGIVAASQGTAVTVLDNVSLLNNAYGIAAATGNNVSIRRSTISGNTTAGVSSDSGAQVNVSDSTLSHNSAHVNNFGIVRLKENQFEFSNVALQGNASISMGANRFSGNGSLGTAPTPASGTPTDVFN